MKLKVVQYGTGKMSIYTMRYAIEKGHEIVGAFDINENVISKNIADVMERDYKTDVCVQHISQFENFLKNNEVDIVIVTTMSLLSDIYDVYEICARNGVNAISTCEEALYPQNSNPVMFDKLDKLAKENNCTLSGTGYQDIYWCNLITAIAGSTHKINKIVGSSSYNVEDYGIALAKVHGAGLSLEDFEKEIASADKISTEEREALINKGEYAPSYMWSVNGWLCEKLGLDIESQTQVCVPQIAEKELFSSTLNMDIPKGYATGMSAVVTTKTKQGVEIVSECIGKVYTEEEFDSNTWSIVGEPETTITVDRPATVELTCATIVNRLIDVVKSKSGYITTNHFDLPAYQSEHKDI